LEDAEKLVSVEKVYRSFYRGSEEVKALRGISLELNTEKLVVIKGPSGSGKTTLVNLMGGLDQPDSGRILYKGKNLNDMPDSTLTELRRTEIGFIFQSFALIDILTAYENVELPLRIMRMDVKERIKRVISCLEMVGLRKRMQHRTYELSGGEQQRVGVARALVNNPCLILADEPTCELNQEAAQNIMEVFGAIVREYGKTVCVVTHDPLVSEYADVTFEIVDGALVGKTGEEKNVK
jgi:putative ABC transport system ATP-binding protein